MQTYCTSLSRHFISTPDFVFLFARMNKYLQVQIANLTSNYEIGNHSEITICTRHSCVHSSVMAAP